MIIRFLYEVVFMCLCLGIASCTLSDRGDQAEVVSPPVVKTPPVIAMTATGTTLSVGDTLHLALHVSDRRLKSGFVDFADSTVATFNNLRPLLDTTLLHIFKSVGSYDITASFSDGSETSRNSLVIAVPHTSPIVTIVPDRTTLRIGDTLNVTLHASDSTLSSGTIEFGDGISASFMNLKHAIDSTISHVYSSRRTYTVTATFRNEFTTGSASFPVVLLNRYFALSLSVGMTWRFSYSYSNDSPPTFVSERRGGIHEWRIISQFASDQETTFTVQQTTNDTRYGQLSINGRIVDTSYVIQDTSQFTFVLSYSSIQFNWPIGSGVKNVTISNHFESSSYPIVVQLDDLITVSSYDDQAGPRGYSSGFSTIHGISWSEAYSLIAFSKP